VRAPSRTILIVEDNPDDLFELKRSLRKARIGNPVAVVTDGRQALDYLMRANSKSAQGEHPRPFLVFLDLKLPFVDGFEILEWIRAREEFNDVVVVVLTSSDEERDHVRAYKLGARSYLVKPPTAIGLSDLASSLESLWGAHGEGPFV
jgi:CheY-like chemotaxis protein